MRSKEQHIAARDHLKSLAELLKRRRDACDNKFYGVADCSKLLVHAPLSIAKRPTQFRFGNDTLPHFVANQYDRL